MAKLYNLPIDELQAQLKALVNRIVAEKYATTPAMDRYEKLLAEIYRRGETPQVILKSFKEAN